MRTISLVAAVLLSAVTFLAVADDTDIYLDPSLPTGSEPLIMFVLDYRPNLTATVCNGDECNALIDEGYLEPTGPYNFFQLLRAVLKKVLDPLNNAHIGFMLNHADNCTGGVTAGPTMSGCSNGAYVLYGFKRMESGTDDPDTYQVEGEDANKLALYEKLAAIPDPQGTVTHEFQGKELYFELFRYLTGQHIYNGHVGYQDFGDSDGNTNLDEDFELAAWDTSIETNGNRLYNSPLAGGVLECTKTFVINFMFQVSNQEDNSDKAITAEKGSGGMAGINLSGKRNSFDTVIRYLHDIDLADGTFGTVPDLEGQQNVVSYFLVDPTKVNQTTNSYANAGGTAVAIPLSNDPRELIDTLNNVLRSILSVSTTFVAPSVPVNVFNRSQIVNEVFMAVFEAEENGFPLWNGNLKKLRIAENSITGKLELQDVNGLSAIDIDGRIKREALTVWTDSASLPPPTEDEVAGADGRAVPRGGAGHKIPGYLTGSPGNTNSDTGARTMYTEDPSDVIDGLMAFESTTTLAAALWSEITEDWNPPASSATYDGASVSEQNQALRILRFARGLIDDGSGPRRWIMGDPLHSRPRPINYGARGGGYDVDNPDIRILMGTNDGVMHMFRNTTSAGAEDGTESWAFVPRTVIPLFDRLRTNMAGTPIHPITVDGSPIVYTKDVNFDGNLISADGDKVYAFFGLRRGGKNVYALDLSDPDAPKHMWTIEKGIAGTDFAELGQTWSPPQGGRLKLNGVSTEVLIFGGGYNGDDDGDNIGDLGKDAKNRQTNSGVTPTMGTDDDEGNAVFIVNATTGALIWKLVKGDTEGYVPSRKAYLHPDLDDSIAAAVVAVDTAGNGFLDRIYAADTGGVVWRIDLAGLVDHDSDSNTPMVLTFEDSSVWSATELLSVGRHVTGFTDISDDRRFFNAVDVAQSRDDISSYDAVLIGSGDREDPNARTVTNYFYMVKDRYVTSGYPPTSAVLHDDLADLSDNCLDDGSCAFPPDLGMGWKIVLGDFGEKSLASPVTIGGKTYFTTFTPANSSSTCELNEGKGRLYALSLDDATAVLNFDTTNDAEGVTLERFDTLASGGIPVEVVPLSGGMILVQGQEAGENIVDTKVRTGFKTYWHEVYE